jgi:RimJ/RimL family protein N-acetyltransferase
MLVGEHVVVRPLGEPDLEILLGWGRSPSAFWGPYQRFQMDYLQHLRDSYRRDGLLTREAGVLLIETAPEREAIGFVQYALRGPPDEATPHPEIGFGIPEISARGRGYAAEAVSLLCGYLFAGYPSERISAHTDVDNDPARRLLTRVGFRCEGVMRRSSFRDGAWHDVALYGLLRGERAAAGATPR